MTPVTRTVAAAVIAAVGTAWTTLDLATDTGTTLAVWGILTAVITGGWAAIDAETGGGR